MKHYLIPASTYHKLKSDQSKPESKPHENTDIKETEVVVEKEEEKELNDQDEFITDAFPKSIKGRAIRLVSYIKRHTPKIKWLSNGNVIINGKLVPKSNIIDLLRKAVSGSLKNPQGWSLFYEALESINTPLTLIATSPPGTPANKKNKKKWLTH